MKHYDDLIQRLRTATKLPLLQALMNEGADAIEELVRKEKFHAFLWNTIQPNEMEAYSHITAKISHGGNDIMEKEYISREAALRANCYFCSAHLKDDSPCDEKCADYMKFMEIPAADVRPVVLCGVCELHGHCYTEDVFAFARLAEENRFCAVGKVKTNGVKREES